MKSELNFILRQARGNEAYKQIRWAENIMLVISIMYPSVPFFFFFLTLNNYYILIKKKYTLVFEISKTCSFLT
jgi:hypothetical protein